jgi:hypothetical protein
LALDRCVALSICLSSAVAEEARQSPALEQAIKIEAAIKLCKLFNAIPRSSPKVSELESRLGQRHQPAMTHRAAANALNLLPLSAQ